MIKKTSETRALAGNIVNEYNDSQTSAYSTEYINDCNTYSTNETFTGKYWIDGKPIYKQVFTGTINNNSTLLTGIGTLVAGYGTVSMGQNERLVGYFEIDSNKNYFCHLRKNGTTVYFTCVYESAGYNPTNCNVVVEYTKSS